jgi:hypothetical protein
MRTNKKIEDKRGQRQWFMINMNEGDVLTVMSRQERRP